MTVSSSTNRDDYAGNGSTTSFAVSFRFLENSHIKATLRDALSTETLQVETTDYTLTGAGGAGGGTLVMIVAPPSGTTLTIQRDVPATQETDYVENDEFPAESHEDALDKLTMLVQQQGEDSTRHIGFTDTVSDATGSAVELSQDATQRADKFLGFDSAGNIVTKTASVAGLVDQAQQDKRYGPIFATVAAMVAANPVSIDGVVVNLVAGMSAEILGYFVAGDGGGKKGVIAASQSVDEWGSHTNANGTVFLFNDKEADLFQYGAKGDGVTESAPIQAAFTALDVVIVPEADTNFKCKDITAPANISVRGFSKAPYLPGGTAGVSGMSAFVFDTTGAFHFKWGNICTIEDVMFHGDDKSVDLWLSTSGSKLKEFKLNRVGVYGYVAGLGGLTHQFGQVEAIQCNLNANTFGTRGLVDSKVFGGFINANSSHGVSCGTGDNDNTFIGVKNEFNDAHNWEFGVAVNNTVLGGTTDAAKGNGFKFGSGSDTVVTGVQLRRSDRDDTGGEFHVLVDGAARVVMSVIGTRSGFDDGGGGTDSPINGVKIQGACGLVDLSNCDFTGINGGTVLQVDGGATFSDALSIRSCLDVEDRVEGMTINATNRRNMVQKLTTGNIAAAGNVVLSFTDQTQGTFSRIQRNLTMYSRNTSTGGTLSGIGHYVRSREAGGASIVGFGTSFESGANAFGTAGSDDIQVAFSNVATDGSTFDITVTNNSTGTQNVQLELS